jgi:hypothetical protein
MLKIHPRNKPVVNLRIGSIVCHLFYPSGKPEDFRSLLNTGSSTGVAEAMQ